MFMAFFERNLQFEVDNGYVYVSVSYHGEMRVKSKAVERNTQIYFL